MNLDKQSPITNKTKQPTPQQRPDEHLWGKHKERKSLGNFQTAINTILVGVQSFQNIDDVKEPRQEAF